MSEPLTSHIHLNSENPKSIWNICRHSMIRDGMASVPIGTYCTVVGGVLVISAQLPTLYSVGHFGTLGARSCVRLAAYQIPTPNFLWPTNSR